MKKRLTDNEFHTSGNKERACYIQEPRLQAIYDKLFELEDIEEELGIDLTLFGKALKAIKCIDHYKEKFFYVKGSSGTIYPVQGAKLCYCPPKFFIHIIMANEDMEYMTYWLDDYGKTWALTKEELYESDTNKR